MLREEQVNTIVTAAAAALAGVLARQIVSGGWRVAAGVGPPDNPASRDVTWRDAILFSAASGVAIGVARMIGKRLATAAMEEKLGHKPRGTHRRQLV